MGSPVDREGDFRCEIVEYGIEEAKDSGSQSVMVPLKVNLTAFYQEGEWIPWSEYDQEAYGRVCIVKKDGQINPTGCKSLIENAGWNGDIESLDNKSWQPTQCQVKLQAEEYKGKTSYKIQFVNGFDSTPGGGGLSSVGPEKAKALAARFGGSLRALRGTSAQNSKPAPAGKPLPPKAAPKEPVNASVGGGIPQDEVPFIPA